MSNMLEKLKKLEGSTIIGMRKIFYVGSVPGEDKDGISDNDSEYNPMHNEIRAAYEIMLIDPRFRNKFIIRIKNSEGWCGSGYCGSS